MRGRTLMIATGLGLAAFTAALWYFQTYAYYRDLPLDPDRLGAEYPIETWRGIDASSSPLKLRVCLTVSEETAIRFRDDQFELAGGEPLVAPGWFDCFDAKAIARDLQSHQADLYSLGPSGFDGIDEMLALYPDGRGYIWRQLDPAFTTQ